MGKATPPPALALGARLLWAGDLPGYAPDPVCYPRGELPRATSKLDAFLGYSPSGADEMSYYRGHRAVFDEAGFERGARAWLVRSGGGGGAISCVAVVSSAEAAANAAARLLTLPATADADLPPGITALLPREETVRAEITLTGLPHGGGTRTTSVRLDSGARSDLTISAFADDRLVYFLWTAEHGHVTMLTDAQIAAAMQALYERVHLRPLPAASRSQRPAATPSPQVGSPSLLWRRELEVASDFGQISICDRAAVFEEVDDPLQEALADAVESGRHVGVAEGFVILLTPGQWGERIPMLIEGWSSEPPDDIAEWQHQVDIDLPLPSGVLVFEAPGGGGDCNAAEVPAGAYRARISGRGFRGTGLAGADGAEVYRIQLWPTEAARPPVLRKSWQGWSVQS